MTTETTTHVGLTAAEIASGVRAAAKRPQRRIATGIKTIDRMVGGGVGVGEVCLIIGKSGSGKSLVGQNIVEHNTAKNVPGVFFSLEMPGTLCFARSLAQWMEKDYFQIFDALNKEGEYSERLSQAIDEWVPAHESMYLVTQSSLSLDEMTTVLKEAEKNLGARPAYVVIDYMELVGMGQNSDTSSIENVTNTAQRLKAWAKANEVACFVLHQTNKSLQHGDAPDEESARYGGYTEADVVLGVWRPHRWEPHDKKRPPMSQLLVEQLRGFIGINVIKNRPRIELSERGWMFELKSSGVIDGSLDTPPVCYPGSGI